MSADETPAGLRARLDALAAAATERPWRTQWERGQWSDIALIPEENVPPIRIVSDNPSQLAKHDAAFIVALVNAWPAIDALLARLAAAEADADRLVKGIQKFPGHFGEDGYWRPEIDRAEALRLHDEAVALRERPQ